MFKHIRYIFLLAIFIGISGVNAQVRVDTLTREVEVTKAYKPTISDANKLNAMPEIEDEEARQPTFNYKINSRPVLGAFSVTPLKPAIIETSQLDEKGYGLVRAGLNSTFRPYAELFFNNINTKQFMFGIHARHLSSFNKIKLDGDNKSDAPFMDNKLSLFAKNKLGDYVLSTGISLNQTGFRYYGYPKTAVPDELREDGQTVNYFGTKQSFVKAGFNIGIKNVDAQIDEQAYGFDFDYHYFSAKTGQREHCLDINLTSQTELMYGMALVDAEVLFATANDVVSLSDGTVGNASRIMLKAKPAWYFGDETANVKIGTVLDFAKLADDDAEFKIAPNIRANWTPVPELLSIYAGLEGGLVSNHYSKIVYENNYVDPQHNVKNSMQKLVASLGFNGKFTSKTAFNISGEYRVVENQPLYYMSGTYTLYDLTSLSGTVIDNTFDVFYDDINCFKLSAEVLYTLSSKFDFLFSVNYYNYHNEEQEEAWNLPSWDATLSATYKVTDRLSVGADLFLEGERKALLYLSSSNSLVALGPISHSYAMDAIVDLNLKADYQITNKLSAFAHVNNLGMQNYQKWFGYPVQGLTLLAGISYSF